MEESQPHRQGNISLPPFSGDHLHSLLNQLLSAFEDKGLHVADSLLPPLSESEVVDRCKWFPGTLPAEIIALYGWRGGQEKDAWEESQPFWFRDNSFTSIARAESEYRSMMSSYGSFAADHELLKYSFPFAAFNGAWYVIPTGKHPFGKSLPRPIISVYEGIDVYFYSIETMVATCLDWVSHPSYTKDGTLPREVEMAIWNRHNPGVFDI